MNKNDFKDPKKTDVLFEYKKDLNFLINLYNDKKFPRIIMISGKKGLGKFTLVNHFLNYVFAKDSYDLNKQSFDINSSFYKKNLTNTFENIIYLQGDNFKNIKIDDIRDLKSSILKTSFSTKERFIVFDNIEIFNINSLNALLKVIEEPQSNNNFILINNKTKPLLKTIYSRCIEIKISLSEQNRLNIIESLIKKHKIEPLIDFRSINITPGNFLLFNELCEKNSISINNNFVENLNLIINLFKKSKDKELINLILFLNDLNFNNLYKKKSVNLDKVFENRSFVVNNLNKFLNQNLNQNTLVNALKNQLSNE